MELQLLGSFPATAVPAKCRVVRLRMPDHEAGRDPKSFVLDSDRISNDGSTAQDAGKVPAGEKQSLIKMQLNQS